MRKRRNISAEIIQSDSMRALPAGARLAYMDLCLGADDDGFVANPQRVTAAAGAAASDLNALVMAGYVLLFDNCALIRHWYKHEPLKGWRHTSTVHTAELAMVELDENGLWKLKDGVTPVSEQVSAPVSTGMSTLVSTPVSAPVSTQMSTVKSTPQREANRETAVPAKEQGRCTPLSTEVSTGVSTGVSTEVSTGVSTEVSTEVSTLLSTPMSTPLSTGVSNSAPLRAYIDNNNNNNKNNFRYRYSDHSESGFKPPTVEEVRAYCQSEGLGGVDAQYFTDYYAAKGWRIGSSPMADWRAVARNWQLKSKERKRDAPPEKPPMRPLYKILT